MDKNSATNRNRFSRTPPPMVLTPPETKQVAGGVSSVPLPPRRIEVPSDPC
jgi:hypothetical protein